MDAGFKLRSSLASQESETRALEKEIDGNKLSESLSKIKRASAIITTFTLTALGATNIFNNIVDAAPFTSYYYTIPTVKRDEIKVKKNDVVIGGKKFKLFKGKLHYFPEGTEKRPFATQEIGVLNKDYGAPSEGLTAINVTLMGTANTIWRMNTANYANYLQNNVADYKGLGYYCFQVGVPLPFQKTQYNLGEGLFYLETPKKVTYKEFLSDINTLYKITKNNAEFFGDSDKQFIKQFIYDNNYIHGMINPRSHIRTNLSYIGGKTARYFLAGAYTNVNLPGLKVIKFSKDEKNHIRGLFKLYCGVPLKKQINYIPGYGDGTSSFPFKVTNKNLKWRGPGYYYFKDANGSFRYSQFMIFNKVYSKSYLKKIHSILYSKVNQKRLLNIDNFIYSGVKIKGKLFFYAQTPIHLRDRISVGMYQDGSIERPYLFQKFFKKGRYLMMGAFITPVINSKKDYEKIYTLLKNSKRAKTIIKWIGPDSFFTVPPNIIMDYKNTYMLNLPNNTQWEKIANRNRKEMYQGEIRLVPVKVRKHNSEDIFLDPPIYKNVKKNQNESSDNTQKQDPKTNNVNQVIGVYKQDPIFYKKINDIEFDTTNDNKYAYQRTGTKDNPFLSNEGPRGIGYYQISGTDFMTPIPVDGTQLEKWFRALHRREGSEFDLSKSLYTEQEKPIEKNINGYTVYEYKKQYTENFGTVTEPYFFNRYAAPNFVAGTPSYFLLMYKGNKYVNVKPIESIEGLEKFYNQITGKSLAARFKTRDKIYNFKE